ncbi:DNA-directed RNA polymerases II, IV and V subunit 9B [Zea mays]|uniref:DNA-directed RNA polymerases II, IV and V subunit 9B n=1 Tax=Zea mays TaxID=4577 RepID=A0A3L6FM20_MAIZE|nr:DNA-directed RNA polymerases II, IV and V subunit 9B [Zea mays]
MTTTDHRQEAQPGERPGPVGVAGYRKDKYLENYDINRCDNMENFNPFGENGEQGTGYALVPASLYLGFIALIIWVGQGILSGGVEIGIVSTVISSSKDWSRSAETCFKKKCLFLFDYFDSRIVILVRLLRFWDYQNTNRGYTVYFDSRTAKCLYCLKAVFILVYYLPDVSTCIYLCNAFACICATYVHNSSSLHMTTSFFSLLDSFHFCPLGYKDFPDLGNTTSSLLSTCCHVVLELWYNWSWVKATWSLEVVGLNQQISKWILSVSAIVFYSCLRLEKISELLCEVSDNNCVYRNEVHHTAGERTQVLQDVASDPTLPRTKTVRCNLCGHGEVVFFQCLPFLQQSDICISVVAIDGRDKRGGGDDPVLCVLQP